jgi:hypothetical protein
VLVGSSARSWKQCKKLEAVQEVGSSARSWKQCKKRHGTTHLEEVVVVAVAVPSDLLLPERVWKEVEHCSVYEKRDCSWVWLSVCDCMDGCSVPMVDSSNSAAVYRR